MTIHISKFKSLVLIATLALPNLALAEGSLESTRIGVALGTTRGAGASLSVDSAPILSESFSLGAEVYGLKLIGVRGLFWERPANLSGFHGGGKIFIGLGSKLVVEPGAEVGWSWRFRNRIDVGGGLDLVIADVIGGSLKIGVGYQL